jgi:protein gp37
VSDKTHIEWTDATWNPVTGCTKVSAGCKHCYAERDWARLSANPQTRYFGRAFTDVQCHEGVLDLPERWQRPRRIFVNSMSDLFHDGVPDEFIDEVFAAMARSPQHVFQVLTKRPARMLVYLSQAEGHIRDLVKYEPAAEIMRWPLPNAWLGVSVEDQATTDERIPLLLLTPATVRWISAEPLLGPMNLAQIRDEEVLLFPLAGEVSGEGRNEPVPLRNGGINWVVAGGESGPKARPMHPEWARSLRNQCVAAGVPFLFKQWGEWSPDDAGETPHADTVGILPSGDCAYYSQGYVAPFDQHERLMAAGNVRLDGRTLMDRVGKKRAGRLLDGVPHDGYPAA